MKNLSEDYYNPPFSHIYVEAAVRDHPRTRRILASFPHARIVLIGHYKDVFCRRGQDYCRQRRSQCLILAQKKGRLSYPGAPVCQNFGNEHFYYMSCMMNCVYDCEYCYLKGMYPSGNMVVFVNLEDFFEEAKRLADSNPAYLCVSYDSDLLAAEGLAGYAGEWLRFAKNQEGLSVEIRTKCAPLQFFQQALPASQVIFAFTLSPQAVIDAYEHGAPSLARRISCAALAQSRGFSVRLCFDPVLYVPDWERHYDDMLSLVFQGLDLERVRDAGVGTFRISGAYLKKMRKNEPGSAVAQFPYQNEDGVYGYGRLLAGRLQGLVAGRLMERMPKEKIFLQ